MVTLRRSRALALLPILALLGLLLAGCGSNSAAASAELVQSDDLSVLPAALPEGQDGIPVSRSTADGPLAPVGEASLSTGGVFLPERLELPAIKVDTDVIPVGWRQITASDGSVKSVWEVADYAAGWHKNSALPGAGGNVVLSGHNNINGAVFRKLYKLEPGDVAYLWAGGQRYAYRVDEVMIVPEANAPIEQRRENAKWIQQFDDDRLTLVSCWPENNNTHRVIVVAHQMEKDQAGNK
jgi:sortase A